MSKRAMVRARARDERRAGRRRRAAVAAATGVAAAFCAASADAAQFTVTNLADSGLGSLRDAIAQANAAPDADTITFQSGLSGTIPVGSQMEITEDVEIVGPGPGAVTLDGGDATRIIETRVANVSISGLSFANGFAQGGGGSIYFINGTSSLDDVVVTSSTAVRGGGVFLVGNDLTVTDSRLSGNVAGTSGGGLGAYGYYGGPADASFSISRTVVSGNEAGNSGGGIGLNSYRDVVVDSSTIAGNEVTGSGSAFENGGGIWFAMTYGTHSATLKDSTVTGNSTPDAGGGVSFARAFGGGADVVNSTIEGNHSGDAGGGIQFANGMNDHFELVDSTVTGNDAVRGGGVFRGYANSAGSDSPLDVSSSVVSGNSATGSGADFGSSPYARGDLTLGNALVGSTAGVAYTADPPGSNIVGADPQLGPLADNGGPTETMLPRPTSPAVDAGLANGLTRDQRGIDRTVDWPGVPNTHGSDGTDIGAAELGRGVLEDPFLEMKRPQLQGRKQIKVRVRAGAGEEVRAQAYGVIRIARGNAVAKTTRQIAPMNGPTVLTLKPKTEAANERILRALSKGRKVRAVITGKLTDAAGNTYERVLRARLKPRRK